MIFAKRYETLIGEDRYSDEFCGQIELKVNEKLAEIMTHFSQPTIEHPDRYNHSIVRKSDAFKEACNEFNDIMSTDYMQCILFGEYNSLKGAVICQRVAYVFSIIELQYEKLSEEERIDFSKEINDVLIQHDICFRMFDGKIIKIDSQQFECDLKAKALAQMKELKDAEPKFKSAYTELTTAVEALEKGDYQSAISNAEKSYESVLKVILGVDAGNANQLTQAYRDTLLKVPSTMQTGGFESQVMKSLPFIRNNSGSDHGAGAKEVVISKPMAKLAVNLAAALDTYLIEEYALSADKE